MRSFESGKSSLRRRRVDRQDSESSVISATSKTKLQIEEQGKLIETEKSRTGGVSIIFNVISILLYICFLKHILYFHFTG